MRESTTNPAIRTTLRTALADILYCEPDEINDDASFQELGLDSVLGADLIALLNAEYGLQEETDVIYQHPSLNLLAAYVSEQWSAAKPNVLVG